MFPKWKMIWLARAQPTQHVYPISCFLVICVYIVKCDLILSTCIHVWVKADPLCEVDKFPFPAISFPALDFRFLFLCLVQAGEITLHQCTLVWYLRFCNFIWLVFPDWSKQEKWTCTSARWCDAASLLSLLPAIFFLSLKAYDRINVYWLFLYSFTLLRSETFTFFMCAIWFNSIIALAIIKHSF